MIVIEKKSYNGEEHGRDGAVTSVQMAKSWGAGRVVGIDVW